MKKENMNNKGFSLVELIIVIAIMAILIVVLAPQYLKYVEKSRTSSDQTTIVEFINAMQVLASDPDVSLVNDSSKPYKISSDSTGKITVSPALSTLLTNEGMLDSAAITGSKLQSTAYKTAGVDLTLVFKKPSSTAKSEIWFVEKTGGGVEPSGQLTTTP